MAPYRQAPPPDWVGWGADVPYTPENAPLSGGYRWDEDYDDLSDPEPYAPPRSTTPPGRFLISLLEARDRLPKPVPPGRFLPSIGVHLPQPQTVLSMRPFHLPPPTLAVQQVPAQDVIPDDALLEPWSATGPAWPGEEIAGFGTTPQRMPGEFERTRGDGPWRNAAAGAGEHVYGRLESLVDPAIDALNGGIGGFNSFTGTDIGTLPPASRWAAETAEYYLGVPDPQHTLAITPGEKAARLGGNAAAQLAELLLLHSRGLPSFPSGPNGPRPSAPLPPGANGPKPLGPPPPGPTGPRLPGPPSPGATGSTLPALPRTVFDDLAEYWKGGLDLIGELQAAFSTPPQPRSLSEAGDRLTGGIAPPSFGELRNDIPNGNRAASLTGGSAARDPVLPARVPDTVAKPAQMHGARSASSPSLSALPAPDNMRRDTPLQTYWPPNGGFFGEPITEELPVGMRIDRYGNNYGRYFAPEGTPYWMRGLPVRQASDAPHNVYEVMRPIKVESGPSAPWFDSFGGGTQYRFPFSVDDALKQGYLRRRKQ